MALALCLVHAPAAATDEAVATLKTRVDVQGELVRLGDLFADAGAAAQVAVFRAPDLGTQGVVSAARVTAAAEQHGLQWNNPEGAEHVTVRRPSRMVSVEEIADLIRARLAAEIGATDPEVIELKLERDARPLHLEPDIHDTLVVKRLSYESRSGAMRALVGLPQPTRAMPDRSYHGRARETVAVAVPVQAIARGATLSASDVTVARIPKHSLRADTRVDESDLIGMAARRPLPAGRPVRRVDLERPKLIQRNAHVSIVYSIPGLTLRSVGRALDDGAKGDSVAIVNTQSKRTVHALVTAPGEVEVISGFSDAPDPRPNRRRTAGAAPQVVR